MNKKMQQELCSQLPPLPPPLDTGPEESSLPTGYSICSSLDPESYSPEDRKQKREGSI